MLSLLIEQPECWVPVLGYEGLYEVSSRGNVRTVGRAATRSNGRPMPVQPRLRRLYVRQTGYRCVLLNRDGKQTAHLVHVLVLSSFRRGRPDGLQCRHLNGDAADNRLENLEWGTAVENAADAKAHGRTPAGEKNVHAKLTRAAVEAIRASTLRNTELAALHGVGAMTISKARRGVTWAA